MITQSEFECLKPRDRGYVVYMAGCREDEPCIPDESNPYPEESKEHREWNIGQQRAILEAQDFDC